MADETPFSYVENRDLMTFCEVKHLNPFPGILFNFIGVLNELKVEYMIDNGVNHSTDHIAPSLFENSTLHQLMWCIEIIVLREICHRDKHQNVKAQIKTDRYE